MHWQIQGGRMGSAALEPREFFPVGPESVTAANFERPFHKRQEELETSKPKSCRTSKSLHSSGDGCEILVAHVAHYCETPLSDTPPSNATWGGCGFQCREVGRNTFPLSLACEHEEGYPPVQEGYLSDTCAIPHESTKRICHTSSAILSRSGAIKHFTVHF